MSRSGQRPSFYLHGIGSSDSVAEPPITVGDSLIAESQVKADMILTNLPVGLKSAVTMVGEDGKTSKEDMTISRPDFWAMTSNKQLMTGLVGRDPRDRGSAN